VRSAVEDAVLEDDDHYSGKTRRDDQMGTVYQQKGGYNFKVKTAQIIGICG
jgi:hypothetical protein